MSDSYNDRVPEHLVTIMERLAIETSQENKERRRRVMTVIVEQRSRINDNQVFTVQPRNPISYLPEEMWKIILDGLEDRLEQNNCYNTCTLFRKLVGKQPAQFLLLQALPHLYKMLNKQEVLKMRLVCKDWCHDIDNWLEQLHLSQSNQRPAIFNRFFVSAIDPAEPKLVTRQHYNKNPFIAKTVVLAERHVEGEENVNNQQLIYKIFQTLEYFGEYISYLECYSTGYSIRLKAYHQLWQTVFSHCPNLKSFKIGTFVISNGFDDVGHKIRDDISLAHIDSLVCINVTSSVTKDPVFQGFLKQYSNQLKRVTLTYCWYEKKYSKLPWNNLEELYLEDCSFFTMDCLEELVAPKLKRLAFRCTDLNISETCNSIRRLPTINYLNMDLRFNSLAGSAADIRQINNGDRVSCPSIETLEIWINPLCPMPGFDFLLVFPFLKSFTIGFDTYFMPDLTNTKKDPTQIVDFGFYLTKYVPWLKTIQTFAYKSNLWEKLPRLKRLELLLPCWARLSAERTIFTREGYEMYLQRNPAGYLDGNVV